MCEAWLLDGSVIMGDMDFGSLPKIALERKYRDTPISDDSHGHRESGKTLPDLSQSTERDVLQACSVHFSSTFMIPSKKRFKISLNWRVGRAFRRLKWGVPVTMVTV